MDEARQRALKARQLLRDGIDPIDAKRTERDARALEAAGRLSFRQAAQQYFDQHESKWSSAEHRRQFLSSLQIYAFPGLGDLAVAAINTPLILRTLEPIWQNKHVTAKRVLNRIESALDWATVRNYRSGDNPARWSGHLAEVLPVLGKVEHHAAMPYAAIPGFMTELATHKSTEARALEILILTATRTNELRLAQWSEIDLDGKLWTVPPERMKGRIEHRVPLTDQVVAILQDLPHETEFVFLGARKGMPLGKLAIFRLLKSMGQEVTVHGFRSSFRDWAGEVTAFPSDKPKPRSRYDFS